METLLMPLVWMINYPRTFGLWGLIILAVVGLRGTWKMYREWRIEQ